MNVRQLIILLGLVLGTSAFATSQEIYRIGNSENIETNHSSGILLSGGLVENVFAMIWFLEQTNGGDVVVLRTDDDDSYNEYLYNDFEVSLNSVTTIVVSTREDADNENVENALLNAEAVYLVGDDQGILYELWKDTKIDETINQLVTVKGITIGGFASGMAILGDVVFTAENGNIGSSEALENPYDDKLTLDSDFLNIPFFENAIIESNYDRPEHDYELKKGRHIAFMARMLIDMEIDAKGIGVNEYTAVAINEDGIARVFGETGFPDYAFFLKKFGGMPEMCLPDSLLTWDNEGTALLVYAVRGDEEGTNTFNLTEWETGEGGEWKHWYVVEGEIFEDVYVGVHETGLNKELISLYPNPANDNLIVNTSGITNINSFKIIDLQGRLVAELTALDIIGSVVSFNVSELEPGVYFIQAVSDNMRITKKWIKL